MRFNALRRAFAGTVFPVGRYPDTEVWLGDGTAILWKKYIDYTESPSKITRS